MDREPGDVVAGALDLAGVQPRPDFESQALSIGSGAARLMMPTPRNEVITRSWGFSASNWCKLPMWSKSVWVSQIHFRSPGSMTDRRAGMNSSLPTTSPVSTRTGSEPCMTNAFTGTSPKPGIGKFVVRTSMSGATLYAVTMTSPHWSGIPVLGVPATLHPHREDCQGGAPGLAAVTSQLFRPGRRPGIHDHGEGGAWAGLRRGTGRRGHGPPPAPSPLPRPGAWISPVRLRRRRERRHADHVDVE